LGAGGWLNLSFDACLFNIFAAICHSLLSSIPDGDAEWRRRAATSRSRSSSSSNSNAGDGRWEEEGKGRTVDGTACAAAATIGASVSDTWRREQQRRGGGGPRRRREQLDAVCRRRRRQQARTARHRCRCYGVKRSRYHSSKAASPGW